MNIQQSKYKLLNSEIVIILAFALIKFAIHIYTNTFAGYGIFRDELYYLSCASRPDFGYVDHPPFSIWVLGFIRLLIGDSVFAIRLLPALLGGVTVFITGLIVIELGGKRLAVTIACLSVLLAPIYFAMNTIYSMNSIDIFIWAVSFYLTVLLIKDEKPFLWILLGIVFGIGLMNKISILWLGFGLLVSIILTGKRKSLKTIWPYVTAGMAFLFFIPFIIWNATYDWAHIEFIRNAQLYKYSGLSRLDFVKWIIIEMNPATILIWLFGLFYFFFNKNGKQFRILGIIFVVTFLILFISGKSKSEYLSPAFTALLAAGGILFEKINQLTYWRWVKYAIIIPLIVSGISIAPLALTILPTDIYISYEKTIGINHPNSESKDLPELPQFYADMFGWEDLAKNVSKIYQSLPEEERKKTLVYCSNYGRAAAIEYYSKNYPLPRVICPHNSYWYWSPDTGRYTTLIIIGGNIEDHLHSLHEVFEAGFHFAKNAMPYENNLTIFIGRGLLRSLKEMRNSDKVFI
jgi:hypothetical protein